MHYGSPVEIMEEIASVTPIYGGMRHERLQGAGLQWPCPTTDHAGTRILHVGKFSRGLGRFVAAEHLPADELPDEQYPFLLTTGRVLYHWHGGEMTRRSAGLDAVYPEALVEVSPDDAHELGIADGENVRVSSRRGEVEARAWVTDRTQPGVVFMTFHFAEAAANLLTNPALDPVSKIPEFKVCAVRVEPVVAAD
jgi:predicted molibdopterin-dependent oxidoreductase YjgC